MKAVKEITLAYAAENIFNKGCNQKIFKIGKKEFQYIDTVYDRRDSDGGTNTILVVYDFQKKRYDTLFVTDFEVGEKVIVLI